MVAVSTLPTQEWPERLFIRDLLVQACVAAKSTYNCYQGQVLGEEVEV